MSQSVRQSNLFAAEDFENIYRSFQQVDFQAYDFDTLKESLIEYVQTQYPEDYNDYIESAEFIATIELLAYLGTSLAFRVDLNSRENFIDTAERRQSIINLARTINYKPSRNLAARGVMKIVGVQTSEPIQDAQGVDLSNVTVFWDDPNNPNSTDQVITILNSAFNRTNPFGKPYKSGTIGSIPTDLYQFNNVKGLDVAYPVSINVNGENLPVEIVNVDFEDGQTFVERHPDPANSFSILYRNDGQGLSSQNTGFFYYFKQGTLQNVDNLYEFPLKNRVTEIDVTDINETDVWVQEINQAGDVLEKWIGVPTVNSGSNIIYNNINLGSRKIFEVISRVEDQVSVKFPDGNFGDVPSGIFRTWVRSSANDAIIIRPENARNLEITIPYTGKDGRIYELLTIFSLQSTVANASPSESLDQVKTRAPQVYYTQDRMVNNKDYNVLPLIRGNEIVKVKATNRTNAGHSRYLDLSDPTGFNLNLNVYADDGAIYAQDAPQKVSSAYDSVFTDPRTVINSTLDNFLDTVELSNFFYGIYLDEYVRLQTQQGNPEPFKYTGTPYYWGTYPNTTSNNTGFLTRDTNGTLGGFLFDYDYQRNDGFDFLDVGSKIIFRNATDYKQATVLSIISPSTEGDDVASNAAREFRASYFILDTNIPRSYQVDSVIPRFRRTFTESEIQGIETVMSNLGSFGIRYDITTDGSGRWIIEDIVNTESEFRLDNPLRTEGYPQSWIVRAEYDSANSQYIFDSRGTDIIFESNSAVRFYFDVDQKNFDIESLQARQDVIEVLSSNLAPNSDEKWTRNFEEGTWKLGDVSYEQYIVHRNGRNTSVNQLDITYMQINNDFDPTDPTSNQYDEYKVGQDIISSTIQYGYLDTLAIRERYAPSGFASGDIIRVSYENQKALGVPLRFNVYDAVYDNQGFLDPTKIKVKSADDNNDGIPDDILGFRKFVSKDTSVYLRRVTAGNNTQPLLLWQSRWLDLRSRDIFSLTAQELYKANTDLVIILESQKAEFLNKLNSNISDDNGNLFPFATEEMNGVVVHTVRRDIRSNLITTNIPLSELSPERNSLDVLIFEKIDIATDLKITRDTEHEVRNGRTFTQNINVPEENKEEIAFKWEHYAQADRRIDPSVSNIIDMIVLTTAYQQEVKRWKDRGLNRSELPVPPTTEELRIQFGNLNDYKMMSDQIIFKSGKFKLLFGPQAATELQAKFKVVKSVSSNVTDNEIKARVIEAIDKYFSVNNWDFGETFYYTELAAYIHQSLSSVISSVVIVPSEANSEFGDLFQINAESNELFLSTATVQNVEIVKNLNETNMRQ